MHKFKTLGWRIAWALFSLAALVGCDPLKDVGGGLQDLFKGFKLP